MPVTSKRKRRERRQRRQITLFTQLIETQRQLHALQQIVKSLQAEGAAPKLMLLGVLAQAGGALEVTKGTLAQITDRGVPLDWTAEDKPNDPTTLVVRLVTGSNVATGQAVTEQPVAKADEPGLVVESVIADEPPLAESDAAV